MEADERREQIFPGKRFAVAPDDTISGGPAGIMMTRVRNLNWRKGLCGSRRHRVKVPLVRIREDARKHR